MLLERDPMHLRVGNRTRARLPRRSELPAAADSTLAEPRTGLVSAHNSPRTGAPALGNAGTTVIALWLRLADVRSTQPYLHADLAVKEQALALVTPPTAAPGRYKPRCFSGLPREL
jgi:hypothetical protein